MTPPLTHQSDAPRTAGCLCLPTICLVLWCVIVPLAVVVWGMVG